MTDTEKIVLKIKEYILEIYTDGYSTHQNMVEALKNGIDYFVGRSQGIETIKDEILTTCLTEFDKRTKVYDKVGHLKMVGKIRSDFIHFVNHLNLNELSDINSIAFERRLNGKESEALENILKEKFDFGSWKDENYYWEPLSKTKNKLPTLYFEDDLFKFDKFQRIADIVQSISGNRIYLLTQENISYEVETSLLNFDWIESAYCDFNTSWLIYISHEGIITFSGSEIIANIENELPEILKLKNPWD